MKYWFYRCVHCGAWNYTYRRIKRKQCHICNKSFKFEEASKFSRDCNSKEAIALIKLLKEQEGEKEIINKGW